WVGYLCTAPWRENEIVHCRRMLTRMLTMKARHFVPLLCSALCAVPAFAEPQSDGLRVLDPSTLRVIPSKAAREMVRPATASLVDKQVTPLAATLPVWTYSVTAAQDGKTYSGMIVGQPPTSGASTTVPTVI